MKVSLDGHNSAGRGRCGLVGWGIVVVLSCAVMLAGPFASAQEECEGEWQEWVVSATDGTATQTALGVDLANNAYIATVVNEQVHIKIITVNGEVDLAIGGDGPSQGDPDFATNSLGVTFLTIAQLAPGGASGEGRDVFLSDNRGQAFGNLEDESRNRVDDYAPKIALDRDGEPHLAWAQRWGDTTRVMYWNGDLDEPLTVGEGDFPAIYVSQSRTVHLAYTRANDIFHITNASGEFTGERPVVTTPQVAESSLTLGVDPAENVFVCYESRNTLYFAHAPAGQSFRPPRLLDTGGVQDPMMRVRRAGKLAIVYAKGGDLFYVVGQSDSLNLPPRRITTTPEVESRPSLDIDLQGNIHVSFLRERDVYYINNACAPSADFAALPSSGKAVLEVQFSDLSSGAIEAWEWDFGDGRTSTRPDPVHVYEDPGRYTVKLTVTAAGGRKATVEKEDVIFVQTPENAMWIPDQRVLAGQAGVWFPVYADHVSPIQGFQIMGRYDPNFLSLAGHSLEFTSTTTLEPEFLEINGFDTYFEVGCIFDFVVPFTGRQLGASNGRRIMNMIFDVNNDAPQGAQTEVRMLNNREISRIFNIFTVDGLSVLPALSSCTVTVLPAAPPLPKFFMRGDVDGSRTVELTDAIVLLNYLFLGGSEPRCIDSGDFDDNGQVQITDSISLLNFLFLGGAPPEIPFPNLGIDPSDDSIKPCL